DSRISVESFRPGAALGGGAGAPSTSNVVAAFHSGCATRSHEACESGTTTHVEKTVARGSINGRVCHPPGVMACPAETAAVFGVILLTSGTLRHASRGNPCAALRNSP